MNPLGLKCHLGKNLKNSRDTAVADWPLASALPLPLVRIPERQCNPLGQESFALLVSITHWVMVSHWVNVTLRVIMLHCFMVLYAEPVGFLVMIPIGLIIDTMGRWAAENVGQCAICDIAQARGRFMTF